MCYSHVPRGCVMCYSHAEAVLCVIAVAERNFKPSEPLLGQKIARCARRRLKAGGAKQTAVTCVMCYGANTGRNTVLCVTKMLPVAITLCYVLRYRWSA